MDTKIKHRILGLVVIVSAIVILLPFFHSKLSPTPEPEIAIKKAPPFPEQTVQVARVEMPRIEENAPELAEAAPAKNNVPPVSSANTQAESIKQVPDDTIQADHANAQTTDTAPQKSQSNMGALSLNAKKTVSSHVSTQLARAKKYPPLRVVSDKNGLFQLQQTTWLIQVGSFKNHTHALRLANQLRAKGYQAFVQQYVASQTHLFIKPENNHTAALALSSELEQKMHLHGVVIRYQPI